MSYEVATFLKRGRRAGPEVSALDAVMGEDWAIVEPGRARRGREARLGLRIAHRADVARGFAGGIFPGRKPQAVVKMIRGGGTSDVQGLRAQIAYLSRDGAEPLQRSEAMMGIELDAEEAARLEKEWRMPPEGANRADRTSHFIVSFPQDAPHSAAERAGRAWAEEMFGSGEYGGDSYDYYTAFHTDRAHPHMHVVVYRRGLEHGEWLKVSQRGDLNYDRMREVLVDVAGREGIELEATTRLARGLHDRPVPDAEYRRAAEQDREAEAPEHTHETAIRAAASLIHFSRQFAADARAIERELPEQAKVLHEISERLSEGREITVRQYGDLSPEGEKQMADRLEEVTLEVRDKIDRLDTEVVDVEDDATRMRFLRQIAELKANTVPYMRDPGDLREFAERDESGRFEAIVASDPVAQQVKTAADDVARDVARDYGVDPDATVERYSGAIPSRGLARQFEEAEERERAESRVLSGAGPESVEDRDADLARMRIELQNVYREGRDIVRERYATMAEFREEPGYTDRDDEEIARDGFHVSDSIKANDRERFEVARDTPPEVTRSTGWRDDAYGQHEEFVARTDRGFHAGYYSMRGNSDIMETHYSTIAVETEEKALELASTFWMAGDPGVREQLATEAAERQSREDRQPEADRQADVDREPVPAGRERGFEVVEASPWHAEDDGTRMQFIVVKSDRGFHPGFSEAQRDGGEVETRHSEVAVATREEAMALVDTFREDGDRGVRAQLEQERTREDAADRQRPDTGPSREREMSPEQLQILRDLERDTDDYDR